MQKKVSPKDRLHCIRQIVAGQEVERQDQLLKALERAGIPCTQPMLSRDLRHLRISKVRRRDGSSVYVLPTESQFAQVPTRQEQDDRRWRVQFSGNLMVLHTPPGHASMVAYDIDNAACDAFLGTVAGDDTVLVVLAEETERAEALAKINKIVPALNK